MVTVAFIHFRTCGIAHLRRAWWSVLRQTREPDRVLVYDNNSGCHPHEVRRVLEEGGLPCQLILDPHGDARRTHCYSVNRVLERVSPRGWVLLTRSDYILDFRAIEWLVAAAEPMAAQGYVPFLSGAIWQTAYDRDQRDRPEPDLDALPWREEGIACLTKHVPGHVFGETQEDAGVWLAEADMVKTEPMNEGFTAWGYGQSTWQRQLTRHGFTCAAIPEIVAVHQHHGVWARDFEVARREYRAVGGGV